MRLRHTRGEGFQLEGWPVSIDAGRRQPVGIVTHAHTDHAARHEKIICTPETALLLGQRWKRLAVRAVPYRQPISLEGARVTLLPAGHILGSAMVLVEMAGQRVLFTGDMRSHDSVLMEGAQPADCDVLVTESTFGRPEYVFPDETRVRKLIHGFIDAARASSLTPVLTGYSLGKAQEIVALLSDYHETIWVHPKIAAFCDIYRRSGVKLPDVKVPSAGAPEGALVVMPPNFYRTEWGDQISRPRVCFCSGWAKGDGRGGYYRCDQMIPLSDHDDCPSLRAFATACGASRVYTMHGFASELGELLQGDGVDASPLPEVWSDVEPVAAPQYSTETLDLFRS